MVPEYHKIKIVHVVFSCHKTPKILLLQKLRESLILFNGYTGTGVFLQHIPGIHTKIEVSLYGLC